MAAFDFGSAIGGLVADTANFLIERRESRHAAQDARNFAENRSDLDYERQKEFARMGIRWKVADAEAAGLHPLYALGGSGAAYAPSGVSVGGGGVPQMGQSLQRAIAAQQTPEERLAAAAQLKVAEAAAERDFAQASYYRSLAKRAEEPVVAAKSMPSDVVIGAYSRPSVEAHPLYSDAVKLEPDPMVSRDAERDGQTAGREHPSMREFLMPGGFRILMPATSGGGIPEDIDAALIPFVIGANVERFGWRWLVDALGYVTGRSPEARDKLPNLERWLRGGNFWRK